MLWKTFPFVGMEDIQHCTVIGDNMAGRNQRGHSVCDPVEDG